MNKDLTLKEIGLKIRAVRKAKHLSLKEFSDKLDMEYNNLIRIEKGKSNLTIETLLRLSEALEINLSVLVDVKACHFPEVL